jgi:hypothetical protein
MTMRIEDVEHSSIRELETEQKRVKFDSPLHFAISSHLVSLYRAREDRAYMAQAIECGVGGPAT